jgi:hypothetical protein
LVAEFWVFPSRSISHDPRSGVVRRHYHHGPDKGDADLDRRQKAVRIREQLFHHLGPPVSLGSQLGDAAAADGNDGEFRAGENPLARMSSRTMTSSSQMISMQLFPS